MTTSHATTLSAEPPIWRRSYSRAALQAVDTGRASTRQDSRSSRVPTRRWNGQSRFVCLVLQVLKRVLRLADGRVELALELALVLLALPLILGLLIAGDSTDGLLHPAADLV